MKPIAYIEMGEIPAMSREELVAKIIQFKELAEHIEEYHSELEADLETGSHWRNNAAHAEYAAKHPFLGRWTAKLFAILRRGEE